MPEAIASLPLFDAREYGRLVADEPRAAAANTATILATIAAAGDGAMVWLPIAGEIWVDDHDRDGAVLSIRTNAIAVEGLGVDVTTLKLAAGANAHVVDIEAADWAVRQLTVDGHRVAQKLGVHGLRLAGFNGHIEDVAIRETAHYGIGVAQGSDQIVQGLRLRQVRISNTGADGIDVKNVSGANRDTVLRDVSVSGFGLNPALEEQAGIDCRGPVVMSEISVHGVGAGRVGIRFRQGEVSDVNGPGAHHSSLRDFAVIGEAGSVGRGVASVARFVTIRDGQVASVRQGISILGAHNEVVAVHASHCALEGFLALKQDELRATSTAFTRCVATDAGDCGFRIGADNVVLLHCDAQRTVTGVVVEPSAHGTVIAGGDWSDNPANEIADAGTNTRVINDRSVRR